MNRALTPREEQVLALVAAGGSNQQVARALGIKVSTVKSYLHAVACKLGTSNRTEAACRGFWEPALAREGDED